MGPVSDIVVSNFAVDSLDLILGEKNLTGVGFEPISLLGRGAVHISVFDQEDNLLLETGTPADHQGGFYWGISCSSTIGRVNIFESCDGYDGADNIQMWVEGESCGECPTDVDGSGDTGAADLAVLLGSWGSCSPGDPCECLDADANGVIDAADLAVLLGSWGPCP